MVDASDWWPDIFYLCLRLHTRGLWAINTIHGPQIQDILIMFFRSNQCHLKLKDIILLFCCRIKSATGSTRWQSACTGTWGRSRSTSTSWPTSAAAAETSRCLTGQQVVPTCPGGKWAYLLCPPVLRGQWACLLLCLPVCCQSRTLPRSTDKRLMVRALILRWDQPILVNRDAYHEIFFPFFNSFYSIVI